MQEFEVEGITPDRFLTKVRRFLKKGPLGNIISGRIENNTIIIEFSQLGKSQLFYRYDLTENGFRGNKIKEKIAFSHSMLRNQVESELVQVFKRLGVKILK
ncbi:MAG: hypothetical protein D6767_03445 [Candidatus Hydrogenedentota bacterium]|nr:MAG: hypothetical protein D6767_03445 [Candidatus Hydrogenedentota bacterium]